ncbi:hypothetical protein [Hazenella coriacea]|nr:hypothetical protein [Hazenella coriacea]
MFDSKGKYDRVDTTEIHIENQLQLKNLKNKDRRKNGKQVN